MHLLEKLSLKYNLNSMELNKTGRIETDDILGADIVNQNISLNESTEKPVLTENEEEYKEELAKTKDEIKKTKEELKKVKDSGADEDDDDLRRLEKKLTSLRNKRNFYEGKLGESVTIDEDSVPQPRVKLPKPPVDREVEFVPSEENMGSGDTEEHLDGVATPVSQDEWVMIRAWVRDAVASYRNKTVSREEVIQDLKQNFPLLADAVKSMGNKPRIADTKKFIAIFCEEMGVSNETKLRILGGQEIRDDEENQIREFVDVSVFNEGWNLFCAMIAALKFIIQGGSILYPNSYIGATIIALLLLSAIGWFAMSIFKDAVGMLLSPFLNWTKQWFGNTFLWKKRQIDIIEDFLGTNVISQTRKQITFYNAVNNTRRVFPSRTILYFEQFLRKEGLSFNSRPSFVYFKVAIEEQNQNISNINYVKELRYEKLPDVYIVAISDLFVGKTPQLLLEPVSI